MIITIHNLRREKPQYPYDIRVDRGRSPLANPFRISARMSRDACCDAYRGWLLGRLEADPLGTADPIACEIASLVYTANSYGRLRLFCWCSPKRCHAELLRDIILHVLDEPDFRASLLSESVVAP